MASFSEEIREATRLLAAFNGELRGVAGGGRGQGATGRSASSSMMAGVSSGGGGFLAASGPAGVALAGASLLNAGARALTPAANAYAVTGTAQGFASGVTSSMLSAIEGTGIGGFLLGLSGVGAARQTNRSAGEATSDVTASLAAMGVEVSDAERQELFDVNQAIQKRITAEKGKVTAIAEAAGELPDAKPDGGKGFDTIVSILTSIEDLIRKWAS
jgi:hypothetical protein